MKYSESLKKNRDFQLVYKQGTSFANRFLVMYVKKNQLGRNRIGISVSKKVGNSVVRHHLARLIRESYRLHEEEFQCGMDVGCTALIRRPARSTRSRPSRNTARSRAAGWRLSASAAAILSLREDPMIRFHNRNGIMFYTALRR